ncbi:MAG: cobalt-precorrin-5B (C(1))-methyltransferase CbiD [Sulfobacillus thermotolerans]|nr:cobalt-precorrin-5B (C(1))-methyltransferase CbiD [Sulfobacillus thermotolerans]
MDGLRLENMFEDVEVDGQLRRLRQGFTTGTCAQAATKAALMALMGHDPGAEVSVILPTKQLACLTIHGVHKMGDGVVCRIIKNGGDDPDATHGAEIWAHVSWRDDRDIIVDGGHGVGRVTKPGLGLPLGAAAINRIPRKMILQEVLAGLSARPRGVNIVISVPQGQDIALRTCNPRLGIVGGISILGTTGIVRPYSLSSWKASVVLAVKVAAESSDHVVLVTGSRSRDFAEQQFSYAPIVEIGRFLGPALHAAAIRPQIRRVSLVGMMGKLAKVAQGALDLHAYESPLILESLRDIAARAGARLDLLNALGDDATAQRVAEVVGTRYPDFYRLVAQRVKATVQAKLPSTVAVDVWLVSATGQVLAMVRQ